MPSRADVEALGAEGMEISVPARGSVRPVLRDMLKHLCSAISYGGAGSLAELREMFERDPQRYVIRLSESARRSPSTGNPRIDGPPVGRTNLRAKRRHQAEHIEADSEASHT